MRLHYNLRMDDRVGHEESSRRRGVLGRLRAVEPSSASGLDQLMKRVRTASPKADLKLIEKAVADQVDEAVAFAEASPEPPPEELFTDVYKD